MMFVQMIRFGILVCLLMLTEITSGQAYRFRNYGTENDLPSEVIYTLVQDNNGYLWVGTTEGLARFDGFSFFRVNFRDSVDGRYPTVSVRDTKGTLWFGCNDGTLFYSSGSELHQTILPNSSGAGVSSVFEGNDGKIYVVSQRMPVFVVDPANPREGKSLESEADPTMFSAAPGPEGEILIGTQESILVCRIEGNSLAVKGSVEGFDYSRVMSITPVNNGRSFIAGTDGNGIFRLEIAGNTGSILRFRGSESLNSLPVKSVMQDSRNNVWVSTAGLGAVKIQFAGDADSIASFRFLDKSSGLEGDYVMTAFEDSEENMWLGFNGNGLSIMNSDSFEFHVPGGNNMPRSIIFSGRMGEEYILGTSSGFYTYNLTERKADSFTPLQSKAGRIEARSYYIDNEGNIWIGTKGSGLFLLAPKGQIREFYRSGDTGADNITGISIFGDNIWLSTINGVHIISRQTASLKQSYIMNTGLAHNYINQILLLDDGSGYVATNSERLDRIDPDSGILKSDLVMYGTLLNKAVSLDIDSRGAVWVATEGNGVFEFHGDSVKSLTTANGLMTNYAYAILADSNDDIWISHQQGISRYNPESGRTKVFSTGFANGGTCNEGAIYESPDGRIFIGTTQGVIIYDREKDRKSGSAPRNNINSVTINDVVYPYRESYSLPYRKRYTVRVSYTGIDFSEPEKVYYSTYLENFDDDWSAPSPDREAVYSLRDGKYRFNLVSVNEDGITQENPLAFEINIKKPVWRTWWFILSLLGLSAGVVALIIREREKAHRKLQEYLESELAARTQVVMKQKTELEAQNMEITDSINYARRIQSSILPDLKRLKQHFTDAFVLFYPRDIVSGDFYWFDQLDEDHFILVCADSTGHGVPGAFMSMIGSTLLQDIVTRQRITKPSEILSMLDKQIFSTLNQNLELGVSNDGMDIVVCEFTMNNRHVRFASAMRPVLVVIGGESYYIKGNRASVGGQMVAEKYFDDQEYYLNEGDSIYLFTDGLPDQFGGPDGKKMKIARLKSLIEEISPLEISDQEEALTKFLLEWKGDYEQVDDILFMGVKV